MSEVQRHGVIVPVKPPAYAKSRLAGLGDDARRDLAVALALDTVEAAAAADTVGAVVVVTDDHRLAAQVRPLVTFVLPDGVADDLNASLEQAAAELVRREPSLRPAALCADLPALRARDLDRVLHAASTTDRLTFLADADAEGTTLVAAPDLETFRPRFGPGSRAEHLANGAVELETADVATLRRDVDSPADLAVALRLGAGPRTVTAATAAGLLRS